MSVADKNAAKRELIEQEIIASEKRYCRELGIFLDVFVRPLVRHARSNPRLACLTEVEASVLECSMEKVLNCSKELVKQLEQERTGGTQAKTIGRIFMDETEHLRRAYVDFVSGYRAALDLHSDLMGRKKRKGASCSYHTFIKNCGESNVTFVGGRLFTDFFILPIQRLPRYRLLLEELMKRTTSRYERAFIKEAIKRISIIADEMNYRLRKTISTKQILRRVPSSASSSKDEDEALDTIEEENEDDTDSSGEEEPEKVIEADETATEGNGTESEGFGSEDKGDDDSVTMSPNSRYRKEHAKEIRVDSWLEYRNWKGENLINAPTSNSFALYALAIKGNPWKSSELSNLNAAMLSHNLVDLYSQLQSPPSPYRPTKGDVIVIGPIRSGQTPVLQALECLSTNTFTRNPHSVLNRVGFTSWEDWENVPVMRFRIIKAHSELRAAFGGSLNPSLKGSRPEWRVIVTLRNPADLRASFFRHVRRMFRKLNPELNFDRMAALDEFAMCLADYEAFVADVLKIAVDMESAQIQILFYEELINDPNKFVKRIADFVEYKPENPDDKKTPQQLEEDRESFIRNVTLSLTSSPFFVGYSSRVGSINQGRSAFNKSSLSKMDGEWNARISSKYSQFPKYEKVFCQFTQKDTYPYDGDDETRSLHKSRSFTFFARSRVGSTTTDEATVFASGGAEASKPATIVTPRGNYLGLGRFLKAFSISAHADVELDGGSEHSEHHQEIEEHGTHRDKNIDPDDSDEEIPDDLINFWNQQEETY